ncbi:MAG: response regulator [Actinomycetota bacterium]|nr:response regulator [Actinomycetota bacterium]
MRVLIVDDVAESRETLRRALAFDPGIEVVGEAGSGDEAVAQTETLHPHVVVMDVRMPGSGGVEATRLIRLRFPATRVVALTAYEDPGTVRDMLAAGATGYFVKGAPVDDLLGAIHGAGHGFGHLDSRVLPSALDDLRRLLAEERERQAEADRLRGMREELIQVLSHELRTPLTVITGTLRYLQDLELSDDQRDLLGSALHRADELARRMEGLELVGQGTAPEDASSNPAHVLTPLVASMRESLSRVEVADEHWQGVRPKHLARIASELIDNAIRHGDGPIEVIAGRRGAEGVLRIVDSGSFAPDARLFDPFVQADMSATRKHGGMGLGLYLAARLCEADGGHLDLRREADRTVAEVRYHLGS